ncbi:MAG TPA: hypothetical protein VLR71_19080 [Casimicrobiaceae bacterium]|nr:hypothetical protein [Casimicrobiaceae bacterium]
MNKRFVIAWVVVFIVWMAGSFVVHGVLLHDDYARLSNLFRTEADSGQHFGWMILAHVVMSGAFAWIYSRGVEAAPWPAQGLRYGLAIALLTAVPTYMIYYVVQPMPGDTVVKQIVFDGILTVLLGLVAAYIYKAPATE